MEIKNNVDSLQLDAKHLKKIKKAHENMLNNYENSIFPDTIEKYYINKLSLIFIHTNDNLSKKDKNKYDLDINTKIELNKELYSIEKSKVLLGNYYVSLSNFFLSLKKNDKIILYILKNLQGESQNLLINYVSLLFLDDIYTQERGAEAAFPPKKCSEILFNKIIAELIEKELEDINTNGRNYSNFLDNTLASKIIKNLMKKEDVQNYIRNIFCDIITDIIEMENKNVFMEPNRIRDYLNKNIIKENAKEEKKEKEKEKVKEKHKFINKLKNIRNSVMPRHDNFLNNDSNQLRTSITFNLSKKKINNNDLDVDNSENFLKKKTNSTISFLNEDNIESILYQGLTHSRLIYTPQDQKKFFNENFIENNCYNYYKQINLDEFLEDKERNPEENNEYSTCDLSLKELNERYAQSSQSNIFMEQFYGNQIKELQNDPNKKFSNNDFVKLLKNSYMQYIEGIISQYKKNFEKMKYFIDKMIYKMIQNKDRVPQSIKNIVYIIKNYLVKKQKLKQLDINRYITEFYINKIIIPFLTNEDFINLIIGKKIDVDSKSFLFYFAKIIKKIFRSNFYDSFEQHFTIFNIYLCEILPYINYVVLNLMSSNNDSSNFDIPENNNDNENDNKIEKVIEKSKSSNIYINSINRFDTMIINEKIMNIIIEFLFQNYQNMTEDLYSDTQLIENLKIISDNYNDIVQQFSQKNESLSSNNDINNANNSNNVNNNFFGGPFYILTGLELSKQNSNKVSLTTINKQTIIFEVLPKIKHSLINIFELIPSNIFIKHQYLMRCKTIIDFFSEMKYIIGKDYISDILNENIEKEDLISLIWYLDYFLNSYEYVPNELKNNDFEKLFIDIKKEIKREIVSYQNDLSQYNFGLIVNNINAKIESMNSLHSYYSKNIFLMKINNYIFNYANIKIDIYEYQYVKDEKKFIYLNKLSKENKEYKEMEFVQNITIENTLEFINYISEHINQEDILSNFIYIENNYKKTFSQINNINIFLEQYIDIIKEYITAEFIKRKRENEENSINNNDLENNNIEEKEKEKIDEITKLIEELIHEEIYKRIWKNIQLNEDMELYELCENKLNNITPSILGINKKYVNEQIWENILNLMKTKYDINNYKTPMKKLKCIEDLYKIVNKSINVVTNKISQFSVDDIFPIFVYLLIKIKPEYLITNLNFIKLLFRKKNLINSSGFSLTQLEMAIQYIQNTQIKDSQ